jgi:malate dehydrogenase
MTQQWRPKRVAVLGASGLTGSGLVHQLSLRPEFDEILLFDLKENVLQAHAIDMREAQIVAGRTHTQLEVIPLERAAEQAPVDLVVVAASLPETPDGTREAFLEGNLGVMRSLLPSITALAGDDGLVMILTNPADVLATSLARMSGIAPARIFGYCLNDSVRFAAAIARELQVSPARVEALVVGEHGDGQVPVWSGILVDGSPVQLSDAQRQRIDADARGWFRRWSALRPGRSSGWTTPMGSARTIAGLMAGQPTPIAAWYDHAGSAGSHTTLLAVVQDGSAIPIPLDYLDDAERSALDEAAAAIADKADRADTLAHSLMEGTER